MIEIRKIASNVTEIHVQLKVDHHRYIQYIASKANTNKGIHNKNKQLAKKLFILFSIALPIEVVS